MQILPTQELLPFIKHYLFIESEGSGIKKLRLFPDGNTGMVFCFKSGLISGLPANDILPYSFIYGQISGFRDLFLVNEALLIIVVFQPYGLNRLLGLPANEVKDKIIDTREIFGAQGLLLYENLSGERRVDEKWQLLNAFFLKQRHKHYFSNQILIDASINFILRNKGAISIWELAKHTGYTERHIERAYGETIGLTPKKFGNIVKLHNFLKLLNNNPARSNITAFCYEAGYADQSHLIKEFRKYTGLTPTQYLGETSRLAVNFVNINTTDISMSGLYNSLK